jgi:hypothetical protein
MMSDLLLRNATTNNAAAIGCEQYGEEYFSVDLGDGVCWVGIIRSRWYQMARGRCNALVGSFSSGLDQLFFFLL